MPEWVRAAIALAAIIMAAACGGDPGLPTTPTTTSPPTSGGGNATAPPIYVVLFTHIEDNTPGGVLGTVANRNSYLTLRARLITMAETARRYGMTWVLQPDWKFLLAAQLYEDASTTASTGGLNILRYLRDTLGMPIDPHSHEGGGYNYTDVAYLLETLGVGGSTVIGGHVWDPALPQFAHWERFRVPVQGERYPSAFWRGDILMGSGTPNHTNDPIVSGVWRPKDPWSYFEDEPTGNIACVGAFKGDIAGINELVARYKAGQAESSCIQTSTYHVTPSTLGSSSAMTALERDVLTPLASLRSAGQVEVTDFTSVVTAWRTRFNGKACIYRQ
jgi:hypothetical protein